MNMNKRGQVYILAAVVLVIAIWGVLKVVNKVESPKEDNFDFYVENFVGERAYVMDIGYLKGEDPTAHLVGDLESDNNLLNAFTKLGFNVGLVMVVYDNDRGWNVVNFLNQDIITSCSACEEKSLPSAQGEVGGLSFSLIGGKQFFLEESSFSDLEKGEKYFISKYDASIPEVFVKIDKNRYNFKQPVGKSNRVESLIFKNLDENYVKVVKV